MESEQTPGSAAPQQRRPRPPKTKSKFVSEDVHGLLKDTSQNHQAVEPPKPTEPAVANPELGHFDVQAEVTIKIVDRYGRVFQNEEKVIMGGMLDPANRGILARGIEAHWDQMRGVVITTFGKLIDDRVKAATPVAPATEQDQSQPGNVKLAKPSQPITLAEIKPAQPPTPKMPQVAPLPPPPPK